VNEDKNAARGRAIQAKERRLFKKRQGSSTKKLLIELHRSIQDSSKFYKRLNDVRRPFEPKVAICRAKNGEPTKNKVLVRDGKNILKGI
jgi:hypothetical protein